MKGVVLLFSMLLLVPVLVRAQAKDETQERFKALEECHLTTAARDGSPGAGTSQSEVNCWHLLSEKGTEGIRSLTRASNTSRVRIG